jgi:hypothetical protein
MIEGLLLRRRRLTTLLLPLVLRYCGGRSLCLETYYHEPRDCFFSGVPRAPPPLLLQCSCFTTTALLLLYYYCTCEQPHDPLQEHALPLLYYCFTAALLLLYYACTSAPASSLRCWMSGRVRLVVSSACMLTIRQHPSAYVSIRQHTSAYVSIREHT